VNKRARRSYIQNALDSLMKGLNDMQSHTKDEKMDIGETSSPATPSDKDNQWNGKDQTNV
jgi:hypothetical protein